MWFSFQHSLPCGPQFFHQCFSAWFFCGIEALILILKKSSTADITSSSVWYCFPAKCFFSCLGTDNSQMVPYQESMEGDQPVQSHSHAQQPVQPQTCVQEHCPGETGLPSSVFQAVHEMSLVLLFSPEVLILYGLIWKETMQLLSGKVAKIHCCGTTPSLSAYELFSPNS